MSAPEAFSQRVVKLVTDAIVAHNTFELPSSDGDDAEPFVMSAAFLGFDLHGNIATALKEAVKARDPHLSLEQVESLPYSIPTPRGPASFFILTNETANKKEYVIVSSGEPFVSYHPFSS